MQAWQKTKTKKTPQNMMIFFMHSIIMWPVECKQGCIFCLLWPLDILSSFGFNYFVSLLSAILWLVWMVSFLVIFCPIRLVLSYHWGFFWSPLIVWCHDHILFSERVCENLCALTFNSTEQDIWVCVKTFLLQLSTALNKTLPCLTRSCGESWMKINELASPG